MADIDNLVIKISASTKTATSNINNLSTALSNLNSQLNSLNVGNLNGLASAAQNIGNALSGNNLRNASRNLQSLNNSISNMGQSNGGGIAQTADSAQNLASAVNSAAQNVHGAATAVQQLGNSGQQGASGLNNVANAARNVARNTSSSSGSLRRFAHSTKEASKHASIFAKELTRVGKMMKLMITRMILRKIIQGVLDGFKNLAQYSSTFDASLSLLWNSFRQLGNSIAAAVSPLLNALAPALNYIIQLVIKAVNVINQLISALTGMGTWTRAKTLTDDYAKSLDKSNKSAKALKKTVLGFDELNQLQDNNSGGGGGTSPKDMFEQVPIDPKILDFVDGLKKKIGELKKYWDAFLTGFKKGLGNDWKDKVGRIIDGVSRIQAALKDIWNDPKVSESRERYFLSLSEMLGAVAGTFARIGLNIGVNLAQGIAGAIEEKAPEVKEYLIEMFDIGTDVNKQIEETALAIGKISDVLAGDNAIAATKGFTEIFTESFMLISENAARLGDSLLTLITQPLIDNQDSISDALDGFMGVLATFTDFVQGAIKDIRDTLSDVWGAHLNPMFDNLTKGLSEVVRIITDAWNNNINPVLQELMNELKPLWNQYIKPLADDIIHIIGIIGNLLSMLFENVIVPAFGALVDKWFPRIKDAVSIGISIFKTLFQIIATYVQAATTILRSFLQFFETGFTQGWRAACAEIVGTWINAWDDIHEKLKGIGISVVETVQKMINAIIHGLNYFGDKIAGMADISIPAWLGGGTFTLKGLAFHFEDVNLLQYVSGGGGRGFKNGGFPEDGWFRASHGEIMGRFDNGQSVVASNEQITNGIAQAVFNAMTMANSGGNGKQYINNTIMVDGVAIARAVTQGQETLNRRYSPITV